MTVHEKLSDESTQRMDEPHVALQACPMAEFVVPVPEVHVLVQPWPGHDRIDPQRRLTSLERLHVRYDPLFQLIASVQLVAHCLSELAVPRADSANPAGQVVLTGLHDKFDPLLKLKSSQHNNLSN